MVTRKRRDPRRRRHQPEEQARLDPRDEVTAIERPWMAVDYSDTGTDAGGMDVSISLDRQTFAPDAEGDT